MRLISDIETNAIAGGAGFLASDSFDSTNGNMASSGGDQRNALQIKMDENAALLKDACSWLANAFGCSKQVDNINYITQNNAYKACITEGGQPGPESCGKDPSKP